MPQAFLFCHMAIFSFSIPPLEQCSSKNMLKTLCEHTCGFAKKAYICTLKLTNQQ